MLKEGKLWEEQFRRRGEEKFSYTHYTFSHVQQTDIGSEAQESDLAKLCRLGTICMQDIK